MGDAVIRSRRKTTRRNIFIRYMSVMLAIVSGIIMVPLYIKFIPIDVYGVWLASGNILVWLGAVDPGLTVVLQQRIGFAYGKQDFQTIRETAGCGLFISAAIAAFIIIIGFIVAQYLPSLLELPSSVDAMVITLAFILAVLGNALSLFSFSISAINQGLQSSLGYGMVNIIVTFLGFILQVVLLYRGLGVLALAIASLFCGLFYTLGQAVYLAWRLVNEKIGIKFSYSAFPALIKLLSYSFLGRAAGVLGNNVDLFVVTRFLGPQSVALLSLTRKVPVFSRELINQPSVAFMPAISHLAGSGDIDKARYVITRLIRIMIWALFAILGGIIALNGDFVKLWVGPELFAGKYINFILCMGIFINLAAYCLGCICTALGNIKGSSMATFLQSVLFLILVVLGTKYFGLIGTAFALPISVLAVTAWYFPLSLCRLIRLPFKDWYKIMLEGALSLLVMLVLVLGLSGFHPRNWFQFFSITALFCVFYAGLIFLFSREFRVEVGGVIKILTKRDKF